MNNLTVGASPFSGALSSAAAGGKVMGKDQFLKLLMVQERASVLL